MKREEKSYETGGNKKLNSGSAFRHASYSPRWVDSQWIWWSYFNCQMGQM